MIQPLTDSERDVLTAAARRPDGRIHPLPENVDADLLVGGLVVRELIEQVPDERPGGARNRRRERSHETHRHSDDHSHGRCPRRSRAGPSPRSPRRYCARA